MENIIWRDEIIKKIIDSWLEKGAEYVECRVEAREATSIRIIDGKVKTLSSGILAGMGIRVLINGQFLFISYSADELSKRFVEDNIAKSYWMEKVELAPVEPAVAKVKVMPKVPFNDLSNEDKAKLALRENERCKGEYIKTVSTLYRDEILEKRIITSEGTDVYMQIPYVYIGHSVTAVVNGKRNESRMRQGGIGGLELLSEEKLVEIAEMGKERAVKGALAKAVKPGRYRVLLDGDLNHLFAHEAVGHASEADSVKVGSLLKGKLGKKIASKIVDLVDDGRFEINGVKGFGWIPYDDEGVKTGRTLIIEAGILRNYLNDRATAKFFGLKPTGNARAQDFQNPPVVRMRNTFIAPSREAQPLSNEELLELQKNGLLLKAGRGGQVDPIRGTFTFGVQEAYIVENGEIKERLGSTSISGNFLAVLKSIVAIGMEFDEPGYSLGFCGKAMQSVPVGVSGVWLLVENLTVGG